MAKTRHLKNRKTGKSFCGRPMTDAGFDCTTCQKCADASFNAQMDLK